VDKSVQSTEDVGSKFLQNDAKFIYNVVQKQNRQPSFDSVSSEHDPVAGF